MSRQTPNVIAPIAASIAQRIRLQIGRGELRPGDKLDSLRASAQIYRCAVNTVVDAYERLVADRTVEPRRGSGYYVTGQHFMEASLEEWSPAIALALQGCGVAESHPEWIAGSTAEGLPPSEWLEACRLDRYVSKVGRGGLGAAFRTGDPRGFPSLRQHVARRLGAAGIGVDPAHVIMTHGAYHAVDLVIRTFVKPGDAVLVDDPGFYPTFEKLRLHGARLVPVSRTTSGPDVAEFSRRLATSNARVFFTQSLAHNPTGVDIEPDIGRQVMELATKHGVLVVDDDALSDFKPVSAFRLPCVDQLDQSIYVGTFSKSLSSLLRVGFIACSPKHSHALLRTKTLTALNSSQFAERAVDAVITEGRYNRHIFGLQAKLRYATREAVSSLVAEGGTLFHEPRSSLFLWCKFEEIHDSAAFARKLSSSGVVLAPGSIFCVAGAHPVPWFRFNVGFTKQAFALKAMRDYTLSSADAGGGSSQPRNP